MNMGTVYTSNFISVDPGSGFLQLNNHVLKERRKKIRAKRKKKEKEEVFFTIPVFV